MLSTVPFTSAVIALLWASSSSLAYEKQSYSFKNNLLFRGWEWDDFFMVAVTEWVDSSTFGEWAGAVL